MMVMLCFFILLLPIVVVSSDISTVRAVMGGNTTLTMTACTGEGKWTVKKGDEYRHVITCKKETCSVEPRFQNRVQQRGTNLTISPVMFDDDGLYIYVCDGQETVWTNLRLEPRTDAVAIAAGGNLSMSLCSLDQVKLHFTPRGSSAAEMVFIVDNGQVFVPSQASRPMTLSVQNNTAVLSGVLEGGRVTGTDSKTGKKLFEVNVTVTGSVDQGTGSGDKCLPHKRGIIISSCINVLFLAIILVLGYNQYNASLINSGSCESECDQESRTLEFSPVHTQNGQPEGHNGTIL